MLNTTIVIAAVSILMLIVYFALVFKFKGKKPELKEAIGLVLASAGVISGFKLGFIAIFQKDAFLGILADERIPILAGAIAIIWVSVDASIAIYSCHLVVNEKKEQK